MAPYAPRLHADGRISIMQHGIRRFLPRPDEPPLPATLAEPPKTEWEKHYKPIRMQNGSVVSCVPFWVDVSVPQKLMVEVLGESPYLWTSEQGKPSGFCPTEETPHFGQKARKAMGKVHAIDVEVAPQPSEQRRVFLVRPVSHRQGREIFFPQYVPGDWPKRRTWGGPLMYYVVDDQT